MLNIKETAATIGNLIELCRKSRSEFLLAAESLDETFAKQVVFDVAQQRSQICLELRAAVKCLGAVSDGPLSGESGFRIVDDGFQATVEAGNGRAILRGCVLEEQRLITAFESVLEQPLPLSVRAIVRAQLARITEARDRIRSLAEMMSEAGEL